MSTWTNEKHEAARARCAAATEGPWEDQPDRTGTATIVLDQEGDALWDAVGTLRDEDGEFIAHARADLADALDEIERLRALTTITDDMIERAWTVYKAHSQVMHPRENNEYAACVECGWAFGWQGPTNPPGAQRVYEHAMRVALEAALNTEEEA